MPAPSPPLCLVAPQAPPTLHPGQIVHPHLCTPTPFLSPFFLQLASLACWLASAALITARPCTWFGYGPRALGAVQWTLLNTQLIMLLVAAHAEAVFRGSLVLPRRVQEVSGGGG